MKKCYSIPLILSFLLTLVFIISNSSISQDQAVSLPKACIDGSNIGWVELGETDFVPVNGDENTWSWDNQLLTCSGQPIGVMRSQKVYKNFEIVVEWRHLKPGGNSGFFAWVPMKALKGLEPGKLPKYGIEIQMLDHGYKTNYERQTNKKADWFTTNGDIFAVGNSTLTPFPPTSPNGSRSFPRENRSHGVGKWNHYYVRCINGEVRLWVNGKEVSGGNEANPREGYICLESEGSPIEFRHIRIRELP